MTPIWKTVLSGVAAGAMYLLAQTVDLAVTRNKVDDRVLLAGVAPLSENRAKVIGTALHLGISVVAAAGYRAFFRDRTPGPHWFRGVTFATLENVGLYAVVLLEDFHPAIRDGRLDSYQSWTAFLQGVWRHIWFGVVLGVMNRR